MTNSLGKSLEDFHIPRGRKTRTLYIRTKVYQLPVQKDLYPLELEHNDHNYEICSIYITNNVNANTQRFTNSLSDFKKRVKYVVN